MASHRLSPARMIAGLAFAALLASAACSVPVLDSTGPASSAPSSSPGSTPSTAGTAPAATSTARPSATTVTTVKPSAAKPTAAKPTAAKPSAAKPSAAKPSAAKPVALLARGASGEKVRELQHRLRQLEWFAGTITGRYGSGTASAVKGFQQKRKLQPTGKVDQRTWDTLVSMTKQPSQDDLHNILRAGPAIWKRGAEGDKVRGLQARLKQLAWFSGKVTGNYGASTVSSVRGFQAKRAIPVTGEVDQRTWDRLKAMTRTPSKDEKNNVVPKPSALGLDSRCLTGRALCVSKRTNTLVWVIDGKPQLRVDVRFGSAELPTRNGAFHVGWKSRNHVSSLYHTPMPYAMFFSGGQAVHYSRDFAARGYLGASHGCVNVRDRGAIQRLFRTVRVGDKVIVYS